MFTCRTPATSPGAPPAYCTCAGNPPTVAVTGCVIGSGAGEAPGLPSTPEGLVCPSPVANTNTYEPAEAGLLAAFTVPSWLRIAPGPCPEALIVKIPGMTVETGMDTRFEFC